MSLTRQACGNAVILSVLAKDLATTIQGQILREYAQDDRTLECRRDMREHRYFVYILTNHSRTLYTGVTSDLEQRVAQHKQKLLPGFTSKYNIDRLVWFEEFTNINDAIAREKQIKGCTRIKKVALIEHDNPHWQDLARDWYATERPSA